MRSKINKKIPKNRLYYWLAAFYAFCAVVLIPWVIALANVLPKRYVSPNWRPAWIGLDVMLIVMLIASAIALVKHSLWIIMTTSIVGAMLLLDAWFDILTASKGGPLTSALASAVFIELPLVVLSFGIAGHTIRQQVSLTSKPLFRKRRKLRLSKA